MAELVDLRASDPLVRDVAISIVQGIPRERVDAQIAAIRAWLAQHCEFIRDPLHDELLTDPRILLRKVIAGGKAYGDCDDAALLAATLGASVGIPPRFAVVEFFGNVPGMSHIWTELHDGTRWFELDVTRSASQGPIRIRRRWDVPLYLPGGASRGVSRIRSATLGDVVTIGDWSLDLDAPLWFGLPTKTWLMIGGGGLALLLVLRSR